MWSHESSPVWRPRKPIMKYRRLFRRAIPGRVTFFFLREYAMLCRACCRGSAMPTPFLTRASITTRRGVRSESSIRRRLGPRSVGRKGPSSVPIATGTKRDDYKDCNPNRNEDLCYQWPVLVLEIFDRTRYSGYYSLEKEGRGCVCY